MGCMTVDIDGYDTIEICGVKYSVEVFKYLGFGPMNVPFEITKREDGVVTVYRYPREKWAA